MVKYRPLVVLSDRFPREGGTNGGGSSNGRTTDSGSVDRGSNPLPPASYMAVSRPIAPISGGFLLDNCP